MKKNTIILTFLILFLNILNANENFYSKEEETKEFQDKAKLGNEIANKIEKDFPFPELKEENYSELCIKYINNDEKLKKYLLEEQKVSLSFCIHKLKEKIR